MQCKELTRLNERLDELDARQVRQLEELRQAVDAVRPCPPCPPAPPTVDDQPHHQLDHRVESAISQSQDQRSPGRSSRYFQTEAQATTFRFYRASALQSPVLATVELSVCPSVYMSVCPSVIRWHCVKRTQAIGSRNLLRRIAQVL